MSLSNEQKNKIKEKFEKTFEECNGGFLINSWATRDNFLDFFLSQFDSLQAEAKEEYKSCGKERSPLWDTFVDIIDEQFPKGQCKERGKALVMLAYIDMAVSSLIKKAREELRKEIEKMYKQSTINQHHKYIEDNTQYNSALDDILQILNKYEKDFT